MLDKFIELILPTVIVGQTPTFEKIVILLKDNGFRASEIMEFADTALDFFSARQNQDANLQFETTAQVAA